ncbi:Homologous-pairing protein 2 like protein [Trachymyrmex septentrionalis]|uniref:Homologous-pairing protein 2 homolog n=1 Tax=Trachymyrmex septentrionalis TaxID=34720 RepID=A0A151JWP7_9HYME|nr:PREDICTED: homologous-pairing protein 2 homolog [Trachymyrmex septentrionalis]XP_018342684.1 PREDICTED: homologous-pairing protein 2 homolog [Trachymyrmex septentrionalis]XP_018342685.1 PREDICTED: homologous-pairing protein 2 homolog [Trachymyrmex septentrionalis]XP_018342686.1 PREDICTED: homologous-pairing protein 2 homolog [Trachymyrmex septentrionalis]KYN38970.1 Homologous-pairing protein 2 like protein [Trachymyrmex septentrionalis]
MTTIAVYNYMKMQNRPYSVNDVVTNLLNEHSKTAVQKAMDELVKKGKLFEKVYGKQKIYCVVQDSQYDTDELMRIDKELQSHANEVETKYQEVMKEVKEQETLLASLKSSLTLEDAQKEKIALQENVKQLTHKLDKLMEKSGSEDLQESKRKAQENLDEYSREYLKRKKICIEILDCILESYPGNKDELYEEIGIDSTTV